MSQIPDNADALLKREAAAAALTAAGYPVSPRTLATKATRGGGPPYSLFSGRALYRWGDALDWARSLTTPPRRSTSEADAHDGTWDLSRVRRDMAATALPGRSPLALPGDATPLGRLMLARLALKVEGQRLALDRAKGRLMDVGTADRHIDTMAAAMRDAVLNWPARVAGTIAAEIHADPHLVQTLLQEHMHALLSDVAARLDGQPAA